ncbi:cellulose-binding domain-containing protein [Streptomyces collinus]|uniref:cellulose-binding domain-containing protein n=1 Tax=Streptomyces collinus TaxID=42684 RepID=UPI00332FEE28
MTIPVAAQGAHPACSVEYSVTSQGNSGFQGSVKITNNLAALSSWKPTFDFAAGQKVTRCWNAKWSQSCTTVTAGDESWNGPLGSGASVSAGFVGSWSGSNARPVAFQLNGTTCHVDTGPTTPPPTDPPPTDPPPSNGTAPALRVSGGKLVDADGTTRRLLGVNRSGGEFLCVQGCGADQVVKWFDDHDLSYLGWTWNTWDCSSGPSPISAYDGTPTAYGVGLRDHLRALNP